ncbi:MAG: glycerophosphodiester phosphodiesterase family protein [Geminicoccales bacterium]
MLAGLAADALATDQETIQLGARPFYLVDSMEDSELKAALQQCKAGPFSRTDYSIGHRGAALQFPEHTKESYTAAALQGAGIMECDVTFTKDRKLVCRHSQCDLHTTTNILAIPELEAKCSAPFLPADPETGEPASASCCTSDITLEEFRRLEGKMDGANTAATTVEDYLDGTPNFRTDIYAGSGTLLTHAESIELFKELGVKFTPELKSPAVEMPFEGDYTQEDYAQQMIDEYKAAQVNPKDVWAQSFNLDDILYWIENERAFGNQAVFLDGRYSDEAFNVADPATWSPTMNELVADDVKILAPPTWMLVTLDDEDNIVPSTYAMAAKDAGLDLITWTLERSGLLRDGGGFYYQTITDVVDNDGDTYEMLDIIARDVGILGIFSDWPATVTYYANCFGLE